MIVIVQGKGLVENQELHLATSLTRILREKVSRCCGSSFAHLYGEVFGRDNSQTLVHDPSHNH